MNHAKPIRDPVHNYISLTSIEREIVDTPDFQRLRFILQNSTAFLTYPNANNCRFLHSLGAMHLSGRMFLHSLKNAQCAVLVDFLKALDKVVVKAEAHIRQEFEQSWLDTIGNLSRFYHNPKIGNKVTFIECEGGYRVEYKNDDDRLVHHDFGHDPLYLINTFWQVARIVGLVHDIGHLPMSHLFENAIAKYQSDYEIREVAAFVSEIKAKTNNYAQRLSRDEKEELVKNKDLAIHEIRGLHIFGNINPNSNIPYYGLVFSLASMVLAHSADPNPNSDDEANVISCIHRLVSGEIDADRLDYCIRDAQASGLEFGAIDIERIVSNMVLCKETDGQFLMIPSDGAISAVESFFHQRFLLYKYEIYHHNVARFDGLLELILVLLMEQGYSPKSQLPELVDLLDKVSFIKRDPVEGIRFMPDKYAPLYDDGWLRSVLSEVLVVLSEMGDFKSNWVLSLKLMLETYLYRQTCNLYSFWKTDADVIDLLSENYSGKVDIKKLAPLTITVEREPDYKRKLYNEFISDLSNEIGSEATIIDKRLKPKIHKLGDLSSSVFSNGSIKRVENISPYISSLNHSITNVPDVHISVLCEKIKYSKSTKERIVSKFENCLSEYLSKLENAYLDAEDIVSR